MMWWSVRPQIGVKVAQSQSLLLFVPSSLSEFCGRTFNQTNLSWKDFKYFTLRAIYLFLNQWNPFINKQVIWTLPRPSDFVKERRRIEPKTIDKRLHRSTGHQRTLNSPLSELSIGMSANQIRQKWSPLVSRELRPFRFVTNIQRWRHLEPERSGQWTIGSSRD